jgi:hypothetical protein
MHNGCGTSRLHLLELLFELDDLTTRLLHLFCGLTVLVGLHETGATKV